MRRWSPLRVIMTEDLNMDRDLCHAQASAGHGHLFALQRFETLPALLCQFLLLINR